MRRGMEYGLWNNDLNRELFDNQDEIAMYWQNVEAHACTCMSVWWSWVLQALGLHQKVNQEKWFSKYGNLMSLNHSHICFLTLLGWNDAFLDFEKQNPNDLMGPWMTWLS